MIKILVIKVKLWTRNKSFEDLNYDDLLKVYCIWFEKPSDIYKKNTSNKI